MSSKYYKELVDLINQRLPREENAARSLMKILCLGKESVYRRLRGEVPFTLDEVVTLSRHLNFSLDNILGYSASDGAMFNLQLLKSNSEEQNYLEMLHYYRNIFGYVAEDKESEFTIASNVLPFTFYAPYQWLNRYRICRWMYHNDRMTNSSGLEQYLLSDDLQTALQQMSNAIKNIGTISYIFDSSVFYNLVSEIRYFASLRILSREDVEKLREELMLLLTELEQLTIRGESPTGKPVNIYISNLNFETSYGYAERTDFRICFFRIHLLNSFDSQHKTICEAQKNWIRSLKRHSTLISHSGEVDRIRYFSQQRKLVNELA